MEPDTLNSPPPNVGSDSTIKLPTITLSDTYDEGHGGSNTKPLQSFENASEMVVHSFSLAHHAHSDCDEHEPQSV